MFATSTRAVLPPLPKMARLLAPMGAPYSVPRSLNRAQPLRWHSSYRAASPIPRGMRSNLTGFSQLKGQTRPLGTRNGASKLAQRSTEADAEGGHGGSEKVFWEKRIVAWFSKNYRGLIVGWLIGLEFVVWRLKWDLKKVRAEVRKQSETAEGTHTEPF